MKKSFTLIELLISIVLFSIVLTFLYEVLDSTKKHNNKYTASVNKLIDNYQLEYILFEDIFNMVDSNSTKIDFDKDKNVILQLKSHNTFHNPFYNHITYFLNKENQIIRMESQNKFNKSKIDTILDNVYIDIIANDIKRFTIEKSKNMKVILFYIEKINGNSILFPLTIK